MNQLGINLWRWLTGFRRFDEIDFKEGWSAKSPGWWALYLVDYGTRVACGGACVSWSRAAFEYRATSRLAKFVDRFLGKFDPQHGEHAGPPLWGTSDCPPSLQVALVVFWLAVLAWLLFA